MDSRDIYIKLTDPTGKHKPVINAHRVWDGARFIDSQHTTINQEHLGRGDSEICANARLIAAAPDMLDALQFVTSASQQIAHEIPQDPFSFATQLYLIAKTAAEDDARKAREQEILRRTLEKRDQTNASARSARVMAHMENLLFAVSQNPGERTASVARLARMDKTTTRERLRLLEGAGKVVNVGSDSIPRWETA